MDYKMLEMEGSKAEECIKLRMFIHLAVYHETENGVEVRKELYTLFRNLSALQQAILDELMTVHIGT